MRALEDPARRAHDGDRPMTAISRGREAIFRALRILALQAAGAAFVSAGLLAPTAALSPARAQGAEPASPAAAGPRVAATSPAQKGEASRFVVPDRNRINGGTVTVITA